MKNNIDLDTKKPRLLIDKIDLFRKNIRLTMSLV